MSRRTSGSAFSLTVKLADVCWMNKLHIPILIWLISLEIALLMSDVIKWQPRDGAVMVSSCWNHFMLMLADELLLLLLLLLDCKDVQDASWARDVTKQVVIGIKIAKKESRNTKDLISLSLGLTMVVLRFAQRGFCWVKQTMIPSCMLSTARKPDQTDHQPKHMKQSHQNGQRPPVTRMGYCTMNGRLLLCPSSVLEQRRMVTLCCRCSEPNLS